MEPKEAFANILGRFEPGEMEVEFNALKAAITDNRNEPNKELERIKHERDELAQKYEKAREAYSQRFIDEMFDDDLDDGKNGYQPTPPKVIPSVKDLPMFNWKKKRNGETA